TLEIVGQCLYSAEVTDAAERVGHAMEVVTGRFIVNASLAMLFRFDIPVRFAIREWRAIRELNEIIGGIIRERRSSGAPREDLPRLRYTEMVLKETMRLYPAVWGIGRRALEDCELGGYRVPAGSNVFILQWRTQRDPRFFPDPDRFDPERWRDDPVRSGRIPRFAYFPFGGGPRVCVGASFAMMEATLLLAMIQQRFHLEIVPGHPI